MIENYDEGIESEAKDIIQNNEEELNECIENGLKEGRNSEDIFEEIDKTLNLYDKVSEWVNNNFYNIIRWDFLDNYNTELTSCARIIEVCNQEETDTGLWEGQQPEEAIKTKAFHCVINDLNIEVKKLIKLKINNYLKVICK